MENNSKITSCHLSRNGYVYIRQSTTYQVLSNTESTLRQYALRDRLISLGWDDSMIQVIDSDLGISGKSSENRDGFMRLMADVANGKAGAIACIEASRLSRCSADWTRLIEICTMTETLLIDTDGIYNPNDFNDRLLLGLKGTMSEAELHFLQERMRGGLLNKARRGELRRYLPIGYEYDEDDNVIKTPDISVREAVEHFFEVFRIKKTATAVVRHFASHGMKFPIRLRTKGHANEVLWERLNLSRAAAMLKNPFYTGAYIYGRNQMQWTPDGKRRPMPVPEEDWHVNIPDHHEPYITVDEFELNLSILRGNTSRWGAQEKNTPPREGSALLQGLCYCGLCGYRMTPVYSVSASSGKTLVRYLCSNKNFDENSERCDNSLPAEPIDDAVASLINEKLTPDVLEATMQVQEEVSRRKQEHLRYFELQLEKARHEEELARARYFSVDPGNRLVALSLETEWNKKIMLHNEAADRYEEESKKAEEISAEQLRQAADTICTDFSKVWNNPLIPNEDKKRIVRHLVKDVTLTRNMDHTAKVGICFQGGAVAELLVPIPKPRYMRIATTKAVLDFLEEHAGEYTYPQLADMLNKNGYKRECDRDFNRSNIYRIMKDYGIKSMKQRYLDKGWLPLKEAAALQGLQPPALRYRVRVGIYPGKYVIAEDNGFLLFDPDTIPAPLPGKKPQKAQRSSHAKDNDTNTASKKKPIKSKKAGAASKKHCSKSKAEKKLAVSESNVRLGEIIRFLDEHADCHINSELADMLNKNGYTRPDGRPFDGLYLNTFMRKNGIKTLKELPV